MKKTIITLCLALGCFSLNAQEVSVQIKIVGNKVEDYWIEVADRNCGAQNNGINSYGTYYKWSAGKKAKDRKTPDEAAKACTEYRGGGHSDWRLPVIEEVWALMKKCDTAPTYSSLQSERGDTTAIIYFPYAGMMEPDATEPTDMDKYGFFWSAYNASSNWAVSLQLGEGYHNNPQKTKNSALSVRCVRTVK